LETSSAVYELNGDYAMGLFSSKWCQLMDNASRKLCKTDNNEEALQCGKWLCHESCWQDASKIAIETGKITDIACNGGIRLYAVPIFANGKVIGAINFGYGNPPIDDVELKRLSDLYQIPIEELQKKRQEYQIRPQYIIDYAKKRIQVSAKYIGNITERKQAEEELVKSENKFSALFNTMQEGFALHEIICDAKGKPIDYRFLDINPAFEDLTGLKKSEIIGKTVLKILPDTEKIFIERYGKVALTGNPVTFESYTKPLDRYYQIKAFCPAKNQFAVIFTDITEIKQAEEELRTSQSLLYGLFDNIPDGAAIYQVLNQGEKGSDYIIKYFNKASLKIENQELSNVIGKSLLDLRPNIDQYGLIPIFKKVWKTGKQEFFPSKIYVDKKFSNYYENTVFKIPTGEIVAIYTDVTEQKQNEEKIAQHSEELSKLNQFSIDLASLSAHDNIEAAITKKIKEMSGAETSIFSVYNPAKRTLTVKEIEMEPGILEKSVGLLGKQIKKFQTHVDEKMYTEMTKEVIGVRKSLHEVSFGNIPRPVAAGLQALLKVDRFVGIAYMVEGVLYGTNMLTLKKGQSLLSREILENFINLAAVSLQRRRAEDALKENEAKYRAIFENVQDVFYQIDMDGTVTEISPSVEYFSEFTRDEILGHSISDLYNDPKDRDVFLDELKREGELKDYELKLKTKSGVVKHVSVNARLNYDVHGIPHHIDGAIRDITERKEVELAKHKQVEDLLHFGKLAVNRENKMIQLKKEINDLLEELGKQPKYEIFE
jgi:PAS domain S-box-containing protein